MGVRQTVMWFLLGGMLLFACVGCDAESSPSSQDETDGDGPELLTEAQWLCRRTPPAIDAEEARNPQGPGDFFRIVFLSPAVEPSGRLGAPWATHVFAGPTPYHHPALSLAEAPAYSGLAYQEDADLLAMRCRPDAPDVLKPVLATWPAVFDLIRREFDGKAECPAREDDPEGGLYCDVMAFTDTPSPAATVSLAAILSRAATWFEDEGKAEVLRSRYGIYPEFSGLGYAIKLFGNYDPMSARTVLERAIVPEYLLENVTLEEGNCRCIRVPPYEYRADAPLDWEFVWQHGTARCPTVERLDTSCAATLPDETP